MDQIYGYARVSTREQNEARQVAALVGAGVLAGDIYMDKQSGADFERVQYRRMLRQLGVSQTTFLKWARAEKAGEK